jgi:hypothetical protein
VVAVALCVLWVRSRTILDVAGVAPANLLLCVASFRGDIELTLETLSATAREIDRFAIYSMDMSSNVSEQSPSALSYKFNWTATPYGVRIKTPIWLYLAFAILLAAAAAWAPTQWLTIPARFSRRTLLIATTLIAVVLGLGVWLAR